MPSFHGILNVLAFAGHFDIVLTLGFLWTLQVVIVPGWAAIRLLRLPVSGFAHHAVASFALSLIANACVAFPVWLCGLYNRPFAFAWIALCHALLWWSFARDSFRIPVRWSPASARASALVGAVLVAAPLATAAILAFTSLGTVFTLTDDVVSWDRWAMEWTENRYNGSGLYPQLLPLNWSLGYLLMGTTGIKLFAKGIMPLFFLGGLIALADLYRKTGERFWLLAPLLSAFLVHHALVLDKIVSGYADVASAFFVAMTLHALVCALRAKPEDAVKSALLAFAFASGGLLTKQGTVWFWLIAAVFTVAWLMRMRGKFGVTPVAKLAALAIALNFWYLWLLQRLWVGTEGTNLSFLTGDIHRGKGLYERWVWSFQSFVLARGGEIGPAIYLLTALALLAAFHRTGRWLLAALLPFYCFWALGFSYEVRTLTAGLPLAGACAAAGLAVLFERRNWWIRTVGAVAMGGILVAGLLWTTGSWRQTLFFLPKSAWWIEVSPLWWSGAQAAIIAVAAWALASHLRAEFSIPLIPVAAATLAGCVGVQLTSWPDARLLADQREKQRFIGAPDVNQCLYRLREAGALKGMILTDYFHLEFVPDLGAYYAGRYIPAVNESTLPTLRSHDGRVRFVLTNDFKFDKDVLEGKRPELGTIPCRVPGYAMLELAR